MGMQTQSSLHNFSNFQIIQFLLSCLQGIQFKECPPVLVFVILEFGWLCAFVLVTVEGFEFPDYLFIENVCFCSALLNKQVVHKWPNKHWHWTTFTLNSTLCNKLVCNEQLLVNWWINGNITFFFSLHTSISSTFPLKTIVTGWALMHRSIFPRALSLWWSSDTEVS